MKFNTGDKVQAKEDHPYLVISKHSVGIVVDGGGDFDSITVSFKIRKNVIFQGNELKKVKKEKSDEQK